MALKANGCGNQVYVPSVAPCDECDQFEARLDRAESDIDSLENSLKNKQNKLIAGDYITIDGNEISANLSSKQDKIRLTAPEIEITVNTGTLVDYWIRQWGPIVFLSLEVDNENDVASGEDYFNAVVETEDLLPVATVTSGSYIGTHAMDGLLRPLNPPNGRTPGELVVRNASSTTFPASTSALSDIVISFTYIINSVPEPATVDYAIVG